MTAYRVAEVLLQSFFTLALDWWQLLTSWSEGLIDKQNPLFATEYKDGWNPQTSWTPWRTQSALAPTGNRKPDLRAHSPVTCTPKVINYLSQNTLDSAVAVECGNWLHMFRRSPQTPSSFSIIRLHFFPEDEDRKFYETFVTTYQIKLCNKS